MTSVQSMRTDAPPRAASAWLAAVFIAISLLTGCSGGERLVEPTRLTSPFTEPRVWAVVPFTNESGVSMIDLARLADLFTHELESVDGIETVPVNRVIAALRTLNLPRISNPLEATALMNMLGVDGILVGAVTAWDAFPPLKVGIATELFQRAPHDLSMNLDPRELLRSPTGDPPPAAADWPVTRAAGVFDASNHAVRRDLHAYSAGRHVPDSAFGHRIYEVRMELYLQFVSHRLTADLLEQIALRPAVAQTTPPR